MQSSHCHKQMNMPRAVMTWLPKSLMMLVALITASNAWCNQGSDLNVLKKPNIILILADDMGYGDLAIQNSESKIPTPNLDQLARDGMRFTDAHSPSAVCTPTRYSILTGRYSWRSRLQKGVLWEWDRPLIEEGRITIAQLLKDAGYVTALIGKWHLGWNWPTKNNIAPGRGDTGEKVDFTQPIDGGPTSVGFDYYFGDDVPNFPPYAFIENDRVTAMPTVLKPEAMFGVKGVMVEDWQFSNVMPTLKNKAIQFIESAAQQEDKKPFFLYLSLTAPHTPIAPAKRFLGKSGAGAYGDFVYQVDQTVGDILDALENTNQDKNTLVVFSSDNGSPARSGENMNGDTGSVRSYGHNPSRPWRGIKGDAWEGGHRVPFIARWPASIAKGNVNNEAVTLTDLMATFAEVAHVELPNDTAEDSLSLLPVLSGNKLEGPLHEAIVLHSYTGYFAIRKGNWKLIQGYGGGGISGKQESPWFWEPEWQLYNLKSDPGEVDNVYAKHPQIVKELSDLLDSYKKNERTIYRNASG